MLNTDMLTSKWVDSYLSGKIDMDPQEYAETIIHLVNYHIANQTTYAGQLFSLYGSNPTDESDIDYYAKMLYNSVTNKDDVATKLFWMMFNSMHKSMNGRSMLESLKLDECISESAL